MAGITEHLGGPEGTRRLLALCGMHPGERVLDVGCGTGHTAVMLVRDYGVRLVALDCLAVNTAATRRRVDKQCLLRDPRVTRADGHNMPFADGEFDLVIAESVLAFCRAADVLAEFRRILRPGGVVGLNEMTLLQSPPRELEEILQITFGIHAQEANGWRRLLAEAGFDQLRDDVRRFSLREQARSHRQVDGLGGYVQAMTKGLANLRLSRVFLSRTMLGAWRRFLPLIGYGLYAARRAP